MKLNIPEEMLDAVNLASDVAAHMDDENLYEVVEAVLRYQIKHPPLPSPMQCSDLIDAWRKSDRVAGYASNGPFEIVREWFKIAYLAPQPEVPEAVKGLLCESNPFQNTGAQNRHDKSVLEAYALGLKAGKE